MSRDLLRALSAEPLRLSGTLTTRTMLIASCWKRCCNSPSHAGNWSMSRSGGNTFAKPLTLARLSVGSTVLLCTLA